MHPWLFGDPVISKDARSRHRGKGRARKITYQAHFGTDEEGDFRSFAIHGFLLEWGFVCVCVLEDGQVLG